MVWDSLRILLMVLGGFGFARLLWMRRKKWRTYYSLKQQVFWYSLAMTSFNCFEGSFENLFQDNAGGPRIIFAIVSQIFTLWGTFLKDDYGNIIIDLGKEPTQDD